MVQEVLDQTAPTSEGNSIPRYATQVNVEVLKSSGFWDPDKKRTTIYLGRDAATSYSEVEKFRPPLGTEYVLLIERPVPGNPLRKLDYSCVDGRLCILGTSPGGGIAGLVWGEGTGMGGTPAEFYERIKNRVNKG